MMKKKTWKTLILTVFLLGAGSSALIIYPRWGIFTLGLDNIPSTITIGNTSVTMKSSLGRDFLPTFPDPGHPLVCSITLSSNFSSEFFTDLIVEEFWAMNGVITWHLYSNDSDDDYQITNSSLTINFRDGPDNLLWDGEDLVDIVLKVKYNSANYYLQSLDVPIKISS